MPVFFIFKGALPPSDRAPSKSTIKNTVAFELKQRKPDSYGNHYPTEEKAVLRCAPKATSNQDLTKDILETVLFPYLGIDDGHRVGILVYNAKGHITSPVNDFMTDKNSGNENTPKNER